MRRVLAVFAAAGFIAAGATPAVISLTASAVPAVPVAAAPHMMYDRLPG